MLIAFQLIPAKLVCAYHEGIFLFIQLFKYAFATHIDLWILKIHIGPYVVNYCRSKFVRELFGVVIAKHSKCSARPSNSGSS